MYVIFAIFAMQAPLLPKAVARMLMTFSGPTSQYAQQDPWQPLLALIEDDGDSVRLQLAAHSRVLMARLSRLSSRSIIGIFVAIK
jgi:hypothetical protein